MLLHSFFSYVNPFFRSRVIVKNLPLNIDEEKLKKHFEAQAPVTDVKLMKTRSGKSRRFGFLGFKSDEDATKVVKYFNGSFINTARISVEVAQTFGEGSTAPISFKEKKRLADAREQEFKRKAEAAEEAKRKKQKQKAVVVDESNSKLKEFLEVFDTRKEVQSWANDDVLKDVNTVAEEQAAIPKQLVEEAERESDDEYENLPNNDENEDEGEEKMMSLSDMTAPTPVAPQNNDVDEDMDDAPIEDDGLAANTAVSDFDWLKQRQKRIKELAAGEDSTTTGKGPETIKSDEPEESVFSETVEAEEPVYEKSEQEINEDKVRSSGRLFLRNLLYSSTEDDFRNLFSKYGELEEVHLAIDTRNGKSKGFAYIQFKDPEDAVRAYKSVDRQIFQGRLLHVLPANVKKDANQKLDEFEMKNLPLKKQNELKRKAAAAKQQFSWNTLYLSTDAVMESVASRLGVKKSQLYDPESSDGAVKQALAEASVIGNVRQYFESKGVDLLAFNKTKEKNDKVILVKNFPYNTSVEEIANLFSEYGDLRKVLMPKDGGIAMVVFKHTPQARAAFTKLAYKRFKSSILYLEKGPKGLFEDESIENENENEDTVGAAPVEKPKEAKLSGSDLLAKTTADEDDNGKEGRTSVFVKNLNFDTTSADLTDAFKALDGFAVAQVKMKPNPKAPGKLLSMGFGFVEFTSKEAANVAIAAMDGYNLDGHKLQLKLSHRGQDSGASSNAAASGKKGKASSKILIKNIPFEATKKDIYQLFGTFGQLRSVRMPKKFHSAGGSGRGFAFAEFITAKEAENAMASLQGTHLLGRRLVMEYAQADAVNAEEEIARMEKKVRKQVTNETLAGLRLSGKRNIDLGEDDDDNNGLDGR